MQSMKDQIKSPTDVIAQSKDIFRTLEFNYLKKKRKEEKQQEECNLHREQKTGQ